MKQPPRQQSTVARDTLKMHSRCGVHTAHEICNQINNQKSATIPSIKIGRNARAEYVDTRDDEKENTPCGVWRAPKEFKGQHSTIAHRLTNTHGHARRTRTQTARCEVCGVCSVHLMWLSLCVLFHRRFRSRGSRVQRYQIWYIR